MSRIWQDIQSPAWWFTAIVIAVAVNILSDYLKPQLERWLGRRWQRWAAASDYRRLQRDQRVAQLVASGEARTMAQLRIIERRVRGSLFIMLMFGSACLYTLASLALLGGRYGTAVMGAFTAVWGVFWVSEELGTTRLQAELSEAEDRVERHRSRT